MLCDPASVHSLLDEYKSHVNSFRSEGGEKEGLDWTTVAELLRTEAGWTSSGAEHVAVLARQYGTFVLRNALALALALEIEDGELGL